MRRRIDDVFVVTHTARHHAERRCERQRVEVRAAAKPNLVVTAAQRLERAVGHHRAVVEDHHMIGKAFRFVEFVGGEHHSATRSSELADDGANGVAAVHIDTRGGFIEEGNLGYGSQSESERLAFWAGRKAAFPAVGRISPDYYCMDGTIPRKALPKVLARMREMSERYGLRVANVFHAGDGNLHPLILYDANKPGELDRTEAFGADILRLCVEVGGVLTGEHGVGIEKRDLMGVMFDEVDLAQQERLKCAFDPERLLNPGKVFPTLHRCAELGRMHVHGGDLPHPDLPRF